MKKHCKRNTNKPLERCFSGLAPSFPRRRESRFFKVSLDARFRGHDAVRGQTLVEFALILTLLLVVLFGITEFGRGWYYANALINGARAGARYGSTLRNVTSGNSNFNNPVCSYTFKQITSAIPSLPTVDLFVNVSTYDVVDGVVVVKKPSPNKGWVKVIVRQRLDILTGSIVPAFSGSKTLVREATMSYQGS